MYPLLRDRQCDWLVSPNDDLQIEQMMNEWLVSECISIDIVNIKHDKLSTLSIRMLHKMISD